MHILPIAFFFLEIDDLSPPPMKEQIKRGLFEFPDPYWTDIAPEGNN